MDLDAIDKCLSDLLCSENGCEYTDLNDGIFNVSFVKHHGNINIDLLHLNIRSFHKNCDNLVLLLKDLQEIGVVVHIIALCETYLNPDNNSTAQLENYRSFHSFHQDRLGGGVTLFLHDRFNKILDSAFTSHLESIMIECSLNGKIFVMTEIYRPPNTNDYLFFGNLKEIVAQLAKYKTSFICGDFNYDLLKTHIHGNTDNFFEIMMDSGHSPRVMKPTRVTHVSSTLIDNIFVKADLSRSCSYVLISVLSVLCTDY